MRRLRRFVTSIGLFSLFVLGGIGYAKEVQVSADLQRQVKNLTNAYDSYYQEKDFDALMALFDDDFSYVFSGVGKEELKSIVEEASRERDYRQVETTIRSIQRQDDFVIVRTSVLKKWRIASGKEEELTSNYVLFLKQRNGKLLIQTSSTDVEEGAFDPVSRIYRSKKGKYSIEIPEQWVPVKEPFALQAICPDAVVAVAPDSKSCVVLGFVQLPFQIPAKQAVEADEAITKRLASEYKVVEQGEMRMGDLPGYRSVCEFKIEEQPLSKFRPKNNHRKRERVYFSHKPFLYFFICDAIPPERYDGVRQAFKGIVQSFKIMPPEEGLSLKESVAAEYGQGNISGRVYTNREYGCFIGSPQGWEIRTSSNPGHLVEMQYKKGKSIARLLAAKGLKPSDEARKISAKRLESLKVIVKDFKEISCGDTTIQGTPGIESVQTYYLDALGHFKVKEVTLVRKGMYYLILCQAIEPDKYESLEKDFDEIISSFGFIQ